ncbi:MAG TPA: hypothetical protein ENK06_01665, partial [Gammaproteobacteria bacterium]|nr:hypothetical protein [Gammaproteobacteria bacterium]
MIRYLCLLSVMIIISTPLAQADMAKPQWTLEMNFALFKPRDENWSTYYGSDHMWQVGGSFAYR